MEISSKRVRNVISLLLFVLLAGIYFILSLSGQRIIPCIKTVVLTGLSNDTSAFCNIADLNLFEEGGEALFYIDFLKLLLLLGIFLIASFTLITLISKFLKIRVKDTKENEEI